jgi:hypothetical protein
MKLAWKSSTLLELLIWPLLALLFFVLMGSWRPMPLSDDSYQYLNVADNFSRGRGIVTALVHFDSERSIGRVPAPLTTFAPGYPVAIAFMSRFSGRPESVGRVLSGLSYAGTAALLIWGLRALRASFFVRQIILLLFVANAVNLSFATAVLTESSYMLVSTGAILGLIALETSARGAYVAISIAAVAYTLVGISYYIRYAGLFLIVAVLGYTVLQFLLQRNRLRIMSLAAALIPIILAGAVMFRNVATVGSWKGGNDMQVHHPFADVMADYVRAHVHLVLGQHAFHFGVWETLFLVGVLCVTVLLIAAVKNVKWQRPCNPILLLGFCVGIYTAGILYAGARTPISFGTRMFLPILPLYLLVLGPVFTWLTRRWASGWPGILLKSAIFLGAAGYLGSNVRDLYQPRKVPQDQVLAEEYAEPVAGGQLLLAWVQSHVSPTTPLFSEEGQATGYFLARPVISLVGPRYSPVRWECESITKEMRRFAASYLILYKTSSSSDDLELLASSSFLAEAVSRRPACGFVIVAENPDVRILELTQTRN